MVQYGRAKRLDEKELEVLPAWLTTQSAVYAYSFAAGVRMPPQNESDTAATLPTQVT